MSGFVALLGISAFFGLSVADLWPRVLFVLRPVSTIRIGWLILGIAGLYFFVMQAKYKNAVLSALSTDITLTFKTSDGSQALLTRIQRLRAHCDDVTGYRRLLEVNVGTIPKDKIIFNISHCKADQQSIHFTGDDTQWEAIHRFPPIPRYWYRLFRNSVVRTESFWYMDTFGDPEDGFVTNIPEHYHHDVVTVTVVFFAENFPGLEHCEALWIRANGVTEIPMTYVPQTSNSNGPGIQMTAKRPVGGDIFKIIWRNRKPRVRAQEDSAPSARRFALSSLV